MDPGRLAVPRALKVLRFCKAYFVPVRYERADGAES